MNCMADAECRINRKEWRKDVRYGLRPRVEITTFSFEQMSGDSARAITAGTAHVEITTKVAPHSRNLGAGAEAAKESRLANRCGVTTARRQRDRLPDGKSLDEPAPVAE